MNKRNRIELCFDLLEDYEESVRQALLENDINQDEIEDILRNFYFKNDLIFSLNKEYKKGESFSKFCEETSLSNEIPSMLKFNGSLYMHQEKAIKSILDGKCTVISTGTGSGKTESFLIPILDYCIKNRGKKGVKAIIIYPMNALAGDQLKRIESAVKDRDISYAIFNGETPENNNDKNKEDINKNKFTSREDIVKNKPDILVTNYIMLERILTSANYIKVFNSEESIFKYIVLDEIHTYNGNKALNIKYLLHRIRSIFDKLVVQIGCSATLNRNKNGEKTDGYISGELDKFIKDMFDVGDEKEFSYIEPFYEETENISYDIFGSEYKEIDKEITSMIKSSLLNGSKNFNELLEILNKNKIIVSEDYLKKYFNKVLELNEKYKDKPPILDFRIHLFLLQIGGSLTRCINCGKHYSSTIDKCNECGHMVLPVYRHNTDLLLGELKDDVIINPLKKDKNSNLKNLVLLNFNKDKEYGYEHSLNFETYETGDNFIKLNVEEDGENQVFFINDINDINPQIIEFQPDVKASFEYKLIKHTLRGLDKDNKKILCFIDNKEQCGRYSTVFGDKFLSDFYLEALKYLNKNNFKSIYDTKIELKEFLIEKVNSNNYISENLKKIIINDFEHWFRRFIILSSTLCNNENTFIEFEVENEDKLSPEEAKVLDICLKEGIYFKNNVIDYGEIIKLKRKYYIFSKGIGFKTFGGRAISLSEDGRKYNAITELLGQDTIKQAIKGLVSKGILEEELQSLDIDIGKEKCFPNSIFYLNSKKVFIKIKESKCRNFDEIIKENLFFTGVHTSEVSKEKRKENEDKFQSREINLLVATPTLEMGIDIGSLSFVYMVGVPPAPSNYAQRAGRAGRRGDRFAGIITICSERSGHDWYYFHNPKDIIEGLINPPKFDVKNLKVLNKHINTFIYPRIENQVRHEVSHNDKLHLENCCEDVFNCAIDIEEHIDMLRHALRNFKYKLSTKDLYNKGIYPNYSFNREEIKLIEEKRKDRKFNRHDEKEKENILATRQPELAFKQIDLETSIFIGDEYYYIKTNKDSDVFESMDKMNVIDIWKLKCVNNDKDIKKNRDRRKKDYYINIELKKEDSLKQTKGPISIYLKKQMKMEFIAEYVGQNKELIPVGYQLFKDVIVFEFDNSVICDKQYVSFMALLHKAIKIEFGLDSAELGLIIEEKVKVYGENSNSENKKAYGILYDKDGNQDVDMFSIIKKIEDKLVLKRAYELVSNCQCEKISGCYLCTKSYDTQWVYDKLDKHLARNVIGYLMDKEKLKPGITIVNEVLNYEMIIHLHSLGNDFVINTEYTKDIFRDDGRCKQEILEKRDKQNETIMYGLYEKLKSIYENEDIETILIKSNLKEIVNRINNEGKLKACNECLNLFDFYKQAFKKVVAEFER